MHQYTIKGWAHMTPEAFAAWNDFDRMNQDIECLVPYLSVDRECMCTFSQEIESSDKRLRRASFTLVVEAQSIDVDDTLALLEAVANKYSHIKGSIDLAITEEVQ